LALPIVIKALKHFNKKNMEILVFKTNVTSKKEVSKVSPLLTSFPTIQQWNFDLDDCDKVLRIVATDIQPGSVESLLHTAGFNCQVLDY
jgi:hypothetical protein